MRWIEVWKIKIFAESEFVGRSNKNATSFAMVSRTAAVLNQQCLSMQVGKWEIIHSKQ